MSKNCQKVEGVVYLIWSIASFRGLKVVPTQFYIDIQDSHILKVNGREIGESLTAMGQNTK